MRKYIISNGSTRKKRPVLFNIAAIFAGAVVLTALSAALMNVIVVSSSAPHIISYGKISPDTELYDSELIKETPKYDCIIILGAKVTGTRLSNILEDRTKAGILAYKDGMSDRIIMSGDHGKKDYDEVNAMREYAERLGVSTDDIFLDHAGFSTYESIYRAKNVFGAKRVLIITQKYHLYRAVFIARRLGLDADGISSDFREYGGMPMFEVREIIARCKDFLITLLPERKYDGDVYVLSGSGTVTHDMQPGSHEA